MSAPEVITNPRHPVNCPHCTYLCDTQGQGVVWRAWRCRNLQRHWLDTGSYSRGCGILLTHGPGYRGGSDRFFAESNQVGDDYKDAYRLACRAGLVSKTLADRILS